MSVPRRLARRYATCAAIALAGAIVCAFFVREAPAPTPSGEDINPVAAGLLGLCLFFAFTFGLAAVEAWFRAGRQKESWAHRGFDPVGRDEQDDSK